MTIAKKIEKYLNQFESKQRGEETITVFKDNRDQKLYDSVYQAHGDRLPSDWIFSTYCRLLERLEEYTINSIDDVKEYRSEIVDSEVDIYTSDLTEWLNLDNRNVAYIDQALEEGTDIGTDGTRLLSMAQYMAIDEIYSEVVSLLSD